MAQNNNSFWGQIFASIARGFMMLIGAFCIGTGASAIVCLYYGAPLVFSLIGGFVVLGIALALTFDSSWV